MKVLIIGGGGQLGSKIIEKAEGRFDVYATYMTRKPPLDPSKIYQVDKTDRKGIETLFQKLKPNVVIDTAALHSVDYCETHKDEAWAVNVDGTRNMAEACKKHDAKMVFVSTDYVFDGTNGNYFEEDPPKPINYYGLSKLKAEKMVAQTCENHIIARPSVIYSWVSPDQWQLQSSSGKPLNFAMWLIQKLSNKEPVKIVTDQYGSPTLADSLAETILKLGESGKVGIYHIAGRARLSRLDFAMKIAQKFGLNENLISPITTDQLKQMAKRPMDSSLNVEKVERDLKTKMLTIDEALDLMGKQAEASGGK
jgi:dTDP-4-dehydrorhamnose reductase